MGGGDLVKGLGEGVGERLCRVGGVEGGGHGQSLAGGVGQNIDGLCLAGEQGDSHGVLAVQCRRFVQAGAAGGQDGGCLLKPVDGGGGGGVAPGHAVLICGQGKGRQARPLLPTPTPSTGQA